MPCPDKETRKVSVLQKERIKIFYYNFEIFLLVCLFPSHTRHLDLQDSKRRKWKEGKGLGMVLLTLIRVCLHNYGFQYS